MEQNHFNKRYFAVFSILAIIISTGCKKDWLDAKPQLALVEPSKISDYQAILDNTSTSFGPYVGFNIEQPYYAISSSDELVYEDATFDGLNPTDKNLYTWSKDIFTSENTSSDWNAAYKRIFYANIILEGIEKIVTKNSNQQVEWNQVKGSGLFFRAYGHYEIAQEFSTSYNFASASADLGIPLRLNSDINLPSSRSSVQQTYDQIIADLKAARNILPVASPNNTLYKLRPTKAAANAMLARVYLSMSNYDSAFKYADLTLQQYSLLMDFNTDVDLSSFFPIPRANKEIIFSKRLLNGPISLFDVNVNSNLISLYDADDLRNTVFFTDYNSGKGFIGGYDGGELFGGLATDEIYLIRAECFARKGNVSGAMQDLNTLLQNRYTAGAFTPLTAVNANDALQKVINERRKELLFRGLRWTDLRRLNKEAQFATTLTRVVHGQTYILPPNDPKYLLPIPPDVILLSGIQQNQR